MKLKEMGIAVEREWWIDEEGTVYVVDLALPIGDGWLPVTFGDRPGPGGAVRVGVEVESNACLPMIQIRLGAM